LKVLIYRSDENTMITGHFTIVAGINH